MQLIEPGEERVHITVPDLEVLFQHCHQWMECRVVAGCAQDTQGQYSGCGRHDAKISARRESGPAVPAGQLPLPHRAHLLVDTVAHVREPAFPEHTG